MFWSSSVIAATEGFKGVENCTLLVGLVFCNDSLNAAVFTSPIEFVVFVFGCTVVTIGAKGFRINGDSGSRALASEL